MINIVTYPNPVLKAVAAPVASVGGEERRLLDEMLGAMYGSHGIGLAAPQVSVSRRLIVLDCGDGKVYRLANPEITALGGTEISEEGCLSVPGVVVNIKRAKEIRLKARDEKGRRVDIKADGLLSYALQHEIDHLNGITIMDHLDPLRRMLRAKNMKRTAGGMSPRL